MNGDQIFWLLRGAQFLPLDTTGPARRHAERPQQKLSASTQQDARRSTRKRIAGFLGRA